MLYFLNTEVDAALKHMCMYKRVERLFTIKATQQVVRLEGRNNKMMKRQTGVGLVEVLVALVLLSIAGYWGLWHYKLEPSRLATKRR